MNFNDKNTELWQMRTWSFICSDSMFCISLKSMRVELNNTEEDGIRPAAAVTCDGATEAWHTSLKRKPPERFLLMAELFFMLEYFSIW